MPRVVAVSALILAVFFCSPASRAPAAQQRTLAQVVGSAKPAVVFVVVATSNGAQSGTGFVVQSTTTTTTVITANHVVEGGTQVDVIFDSDEHKRYQAEVVKRDHKRDVAMLRVAVGNRPNLELEQPSDIQEGTSIVLIGYPLATLEFRRVQGDSLRPSVHSGIVSAIRFNGELIQFDAATYHGDSGAPIIDVTTGKVLAIVHGAELDPSYAAKGLEQTLPGSSFGPSSATIAAVMFGTPTQDNADTSGESMSTSSTVASAGGRSGANSASYRIGYGVPHEVVTNGDTGSGAQIDQAVESSALDRLTTYLKADNSLYLIPVDVPPSAVSNSQSLSGFCDDARLDGITVPTYSWSLTGGPRYNGYGAMVGYSGTAQATVSFFVFDCYGEPFFYEQKTKSENRYFAHRAPDREIVDMTNDLLDQLMNDFTQARAQHAGVWQGLLKTGIALDPSDTTLHSMMFFSKQPEGYKVFVVVPNGPADKAGVRVQDVILTVNGQDISSFTPDQLIAQVKMQSYTITVQRPGGTVTLTVHPEAYSDLLKELQH